MTRLFSLLAFAIGIAVIFWMARAVAPGHLLASVVMLLIALAYAAGGAELWAYQRATGALHRAVLQAPGGDQDSWLEQLPEALRQPVQQRLAGEGGGLPVPILTPYLVGLLVMLGLMGTFVGMVETLGGAVRALEGSTELSAIRAGLAAPIQGLGMAFGTSVAGVAASAMLGFIATLSRRDRLAACRELDRLRDGPLREQSLSHQRQLTYSALQQQAEALPALVGQMSALGERLGAVGEQLERRGEQLETQLLARQTAFQQQLETEFRALGEHVAEALQYSLAESGRQAGETVKPLVAELLAGLEQDLERRHRQLDDTALARLESMDSALRQSREALVAGWQQGLEQQQRDNRELTTSLEQTLVRAAAQLVESAEARDQALAVLNQQLLEQQREQMTAQQAAEQHWQQSVAERSQALMDTLQAQLAELRALEERRGDLAAQQLESLERSASERLDALQSAATDQLEQLQTTTARQLAELGHSLEAPLAEVLAAAAEAPRSAAQLIETLRAEMSAHLSRDKALLEERQALMQELSAWAAALGDNQRSQQVALEQLLAHSGESLETLVTRNTEQVERWLNHSGEQLESLLARTGEHLQQWLTHSGDSLTQLNQRVGEDLGHSSERVGASLDQCSRQLAESLEALGERVADHLEQRGSELAGLGEQLSSSALEMAGLGDTFAAAVQQFSDSNRELLAALASVEQGLAESGERSDEQMAYYVAQAREIIDHNLVSQQAILGRLEDLAEHAAATSAGAQAEAAEA